MIYIELVATPPSWPPPRTPTEGPNFDIHRARRNDSELNPELYRHGGPPPTSLPAPGGAPPPPPPPPPKFPPRFSNFFRRFRAGRGKPPARLGVCLWGNPEDFFAPRFFFFPPLSSPLPSPFLLRSFSFFSSPFFSVPLRSSPFPSSAPPPLRLRFPSAPRQPSIPGRLMRDQNRHPAAPP